MQISANEDKQFGSCLSFVTALFDRFSALEVERGDRNRARDISLVIKNRVTNRPSSSSALRDDYRFVPASLVIMFRTFKIPCPITGLLRRF